MVKDKTQANLRLAFSAGALGVLVLYTVCTVMIFGADRQFSSYSFRHEIMNTVLVAVPFITLTLFCMAERVLDRINTRWFVWGIFLIYFLENILFNVIGNGMLTPIFCNSALNRLDTAVAVVTGVRVFLLFVIPIAHRLFVKLYSVGMIAFLALSFVYMVGSTDYIGEYFLKYALAIAADTAFHLALYYFADLMTKTNGWLSALDTDIFDLEDEEFEEDTFAYEQSEPRLQDYKRIAMYAIHNEIPAFFEAHTFLERLSRGCFWEEEGRYYTAEEYRDCLLTLRRLAKQINRQWEAYISDEFFIRLDTLLIDYEEPYTFKVGVIAAAQGFMEQISSSWLTTLFSHEDYMEQHQVWAEE